MEKRNQRPGRKPCSQAAMSSVAATNPRGGGITCRGGLEGEGEGERGRARGRTRAGSPEMDPDGSAGDAGGGRVS